MLKQLASLGIRVRPGIADEDLLYSRGGTMDSPVECLELLCVLGNEVERGDFERISDDIWHFDAECIGGRGDYIRLLERFAALAKGALPLTDIRDDVDIENGMAWVEFSLEGKKFRWDLAVNDDWVDPEIYSQLQQLAMQRGSGKRFFIAILAQDSLISFGDDQMRQALSKLSGLDFRWE